MKSNLTLISEPELRPVYIDDSIQGLFHRWVDVSQIVEPSPMVGGHGGGVVRDTFALVEIPGGNIKRVAPERIRFSDSGNKTLQIAWMPLEILKADEENAGRVNYGKK